MAFFLTASHSFYLFSTHSITFYFSYFPRLFLRSFNSLLSSASKVKTFFIGRDHVSDFAWRAWWDNTKGVFHIRYKEDLLCEYHTRKHLLFFFSKHIITQLSQPWNTAEALKYRYLELLKNTYWQKKAPNIRYTFILNFVWIYGYIILFKDFFLGTISYV